jgi:hypothetical protein
MSEILIKEIQHKEHQEWLSQLNFYQDEIKIFQNEVMLVLHRYPNRMSMIEHVDEYRKIFLKKLRQIDRLRNAINLYERQLFEEPENDEPSSPEREKIAKAFARFVRDFEDLKKNFRKFVSHND